MRKTVLGLMACAGLMGCGSVTDDSGLELVEVVPNDLVVLDDLEVGDDVHIVGNLVVDGTITSGGGNVMVPEDVDILAASILEPNHLEEFKVGDLVPLSVMVIGQGDFHLACQWPDATFSDQDLVIGVDGLVTVDFNHTFLIPINTGAINCRAALKPLETDEAENEDGPEPVTVSVYINVVTP
ncbi:MAG: hypothetical protein AAB468_00030 [Patescibacteria group bacterium]